MEIKAINYTGLNYQSVGEEKTKENLRLMKKVTACNAVIIVIGALQEKPDSIDLDYEHDSMPKDSDLIDFIGFAKKLGLQVILKPVVHCQNGSERELIMSSQEDFEQWFENYKEYILHYAEIAESTQCEMFFVGSRLTSLECYQDVFESFILQIRSIYHGKLTYEADVYGENRIGFWNCLDVIATSGNYSYREMEKEWNRLTQLAAILKMDLFFSECGCMSTKGSADKPNDWTLEGMLSLEEQVDYIQRVFLQCKRNRYVKGIGIRCWNNRRQSEHIAAHDKHYFIYGKPVCESIYQEWSEVYPIQVAI